MSPRRARPLPVAARVFRTRDAPSLGVSARRLRAGDLTSPFTGMRSRASDPLDLATRAAALSERLHPDGAVSHVTAAALHGLPLPRRFRHDVIHTTVPPPRRALRMRGVAGHQAELAASDTVVVAGTPVTTLDRTWCDLATLLFLPELVAVGDAIVGGLRVEPDPSARERFTRSATPVDREVLARAIAARPRLRGIRARRQAVGLLDGRSESPKESELRLLIAASGLPCPEPQVEVYDHIGRFVARVDLAYRDRRLALEYEGDHHRTERDQWRSDITRTRTLAALGWTVLRCTQHDLAQPALLLSFLRRLL